ncbi:MAG: DUF5916 domain-containing protein, partial [Rhodothermia bacterium]
MWRPPVISRAVIAAVGLLLLRTSDGLSQDDRLRLQRVEVPIKLDGNVTDEEWGNISPLPLVVYQPVFEADPSEKTEIRVAYDDNYLYVSGRLYDSDPSGIRANSLYRDRWSGDDTFAIILDTFNDNETGLWFFTTPNGVRLDMSVSNDLNFGGGSPFGGVINSSWNTFWDVETQITDEGWFVEMRIPYSSLGFQDIDGQVEMGMSVYRFISRLNERHVYPAIPPNWNMGFAKPSQAQRVILEGVSSQKPIYITPYGLAGPNRTTELNNDETAYLVNNDPTRQVGLDVKYNITSNLTADLTINTDFAQVEADDQQVNLTRFSLFFPEKRQFFQERSGIFEFNQGFRERLFHSRRIGVFEGEIIPIFGGMRLVGRVGSWDIGVLNMQTAESSELPSENFGVARLRRRVFNPFSTVGGMWTSRLGVDGSYNVAYGLDGIVRVVGDEYVALKFAQTFDDAIASVYDFDFVESSLIYARWERRTNQNLGYSFYYQRTGRDYEPGIGFKRRDNVAQVFGRVSYDWFAPSQSKIRLFTPSLLATSFFRNEDGSTESTFVRGGLGFGFKSSAQAQIRSEWNYEDVRDEPVSFPGDTEIGPGTYRFIQIQGGFDLSTGSLIRGGVGGQVGTFYGGTAFTLGVSPTWNVSRYLELGGSYTYTKADFPDSNQGFTVHLAQIRAQIGFKTKASLSGFL